MYFCVFYGVRLTMFFHATLCNVSAYFLSRYVMDEFNQAKSRLFENNMPQIQNLLILHMREGYTVVGKSEIWQNYSGGGRYNPIFVKFHQNLPLFTQNITIFFHNDPLLNFLRHIAIFFLLNICNILCKKYILDMWCVYGFFFISWFAKYVQFLSFFQKIERINTIYLLFFSQLHRK